MKDLIQKIAREWLASKVILATIRVKPRTNFWAARGSKEWDVTIGPNRHTLLADYDKGSWGNHTYILDFDGTPLGWLSKHAVYANLNGENEWDYDLYTLKDINKRILFDEEDMPLEKLLGQFLEKLLRRGDLILVASRCDRRGDLGAIEKRAYGGWITKTLQGIDHDDERGTSSSQVRQAINRIEQKLVNEFASWNVKATINITNDFRQPSKRVEFGYVDYDLTGQFWLPPDMDPTEFVGLVETILNVHRVSLRDLKKGPGGAWIYKQEMFQGTRSTF